MTYLVVYHANCPDGRAAAWVAGKHLPADTVFLARQYDKSCDEEILEKAKGAVVLYLDFSTSRESLQKLCAVAEEVVVLDHHTTARDELTKLIDAPRNLRIAFDMNRCGAAMAWDFFVNPRYRPLSEQRVGPAEWIGLGGPNVLLKLNRFIAYVQDRDLWRFQEPESEAVNAWMASFPNDFMSCDVMDHAITHDFPTVVSMGHAILRFQQRRVEALLKNAYTVRIAGPNMTFYDVPCVNTGSFISEVGDALNKANPQAPFTATWFIRADGKKVWSLRVSKDKVFDASPIAKHNGGGGHQKACGWTEGAPSA